jgi:hypothetical protein
VRLEARWRAPVQPNIEQEKVNFIAPVFDLDRDYDCNVASPRNDLARRCCRRNQDWTPFPVDRLGRAFRRTLGRRRMEYRRGARSHEFEKERRRRKQDF